MAIDLRDLDHADMEALMLRLGERRFRADQVFRWVHARGAMTLDEMTDVSRALRQRLQDQVVIGGPALEGEQVSADGTRKLRLATADGRLIETVLIPEGDARQSPSAPAGLPDERLLTRARPSRGEDNDEEDEDAGRKLTLCISSQVGCALDCRFCATAQLGFGRHLRVGEIVGQVYLAERLLSRLPPDDPTRRAGGTRVTNVVFMGMGEPLHNYENVVQSLRLLLDPRGRNLSRRRVTVSTAGLVPGIERLAGEGLGMNLAVSLNATTDEQRDRIMPINRRYNLATLLGALRRYPLERRQRITIEYVLLAGVNDSLEDADRLPRLLHGIPCKINLIPWNPHPASSFLRPDPAHVLRFQQALLAQDMSVYLRKTRGVDIDAACGQLAAGGILARKGRRSCQGHVVPV